MENYGISSNYATYMAVSNIDSILNLEQVWEKHGEEITHRPHLLGNIMFDFYRQRLFSIGMMEEEGQMSKAKELLLVLLGEVQWDLVVKIVVEHLNKQKIKKEQEEDLWKHYEK